MFKFFQGKYGYGLFYVWLMVCTANANSASEQSPLEEYRAITRSIEAMKTNNQHLQKLLETQASEKKSLIQQAKDIEVTQREALPMSLKMLENLDKFVTMDVPFLPEERATRLSQLKDMMLKADVTDAEKFRRLLEAYQIETAYGNTLETYKGVLPLNGVDVAVDFLRLGRVALFYQRLDGSEVGLWNKETKRWEILPSNYARAIGKGLRVAHKETAPDMLVLPVFAPEVKK